MANPYVNKVVLGSEVLIDLTSDSVTADKMLSGTTAHDKSGNTIIGTKNLAEATYSDETVILTDGFPVEVLDG